MKTVYMLPTPAQAAKDTTNAIHQIVLQLQKNLPTYGWEVTESPDFADLVVGHAGQTDGKTQVDVAHCHGLYPTAQPDSESNPYFAANAHVTYNLRTASQITVPSEWVADILRRDMHINPHVVGWAIDCDQWKPGDNHGYVLWNKTRQGGVCDPTPLIELARLRPDQKFVTTFGDGGENVKTIGRQPYLTMREYVRRSGIYLATTLETFGIGTLEAMACGIPILGYNWGGTADLVENGVTGLLVNPGDNSALSAALDYCIEHRDILGANARQAATRYTWGAVAERFAAIYNLALPRSLGAPKVTIVIPVYNYARYVGEAIQSVLTQETKFDVEIIVVDDHSTDDSRKVATDALKGNGRVIQTPANGGPAIARNEGIKLAQGQYILCLDADDRLGDPRMLQTLADELDRDRSIGIAFTGLTPIDADGRETGQSQWPAGYDFERQLLGGNQVPTCCMFRKELWSRAGGYRPNVVPTEDADLWLRIGLIGYPAKQVTQAGWFHYRMHNQSLTAHIRAGNKYEPQWAQQHRRAKVNRPFASAGKPSRGSWPVRNYNAPEVSIIIPVGPGHEKYLPDALDSVEAQTFWNWECHVIFDFDYVIPPDELTAYPWVKFHWTEGGKGAGAARNVGIQNARGKFLAFLDADDYWKAEFLEKTVKAFRNTGRYIYTDWISITKQGQIETHMTPDFVPSLFFRQASTHSISVLIPRRDVLEVGGFDETIPSWEDTDFFMKLAVKGICGYRLPEPLLIYRYLTGHRRELALTMTDELKGILRSRYPDYIEGKMDCGCGGAVRTSAETTALPDSSDMVRVQYRGEGVPVAAATLRGTATQHNYGRRKADDVFFVYPADLQAMPDVLHTFEDFDVPPLPTPAIGAPVRISA